MPSPTLVILIALPVGLMLLGLVWFGRYQQEQLDKRVRSRLIRQKADELLEAWEYLVAIDDQKDMQQAILAGIADFYQRSVNELPKKERSSTDTHFDVSVFQKRLDKSPDSRRLITNSRELVQAKKKFSCLLKSLGVMVRRNVITESGKQEYRLHLRSILLESEVESYIIKGKEAGQSGDITTASGHFKMAKRLLNDFDMNYPGKNERIREVNQYMTSLYNGGKDIENALDKALAEEEASNDQNEYGIPKDPNTQVRQKF